MRLVGFFFYFVFISCLRPVNAALYDNVRGFAHCADRGVGAPTFEPPDRIHLAESVWVEKKPRMQSRIRGRPPTSTLHFTLCSREGRDRPPLSLTLSLSLRSDGASPAARLLTLMTTCTRPAPARGKKKGVRRVCRDGRACVRLCGHCGM